SPAGSSSWPGSSSRRRRPRPSEAGRRRPTKTRRQRPIGAEVESAAETPAPRAEIVFLDDDFAVVDKPAGLVVHPAPSRRGETLVSQLEGLLGGGPEAERAGIVHRLDRDTSGLMVVARNDAAHAALQGQI